MEKETLTFEELQAKYKEEHAALLELKRQVSGNVVYTENPYSFNTFLWHTRWGKGQFTIRTRPGEDGEAFMWRIRGMLEKAESIGWQPQEGMPDYSKPPQPAPAAAPPAQPAPPPQYGNGGSSAPSGTSHAVLMKVGKSYSGGKPQLQFECEGMEHPLSFTRGVPEMIQLLSLVGQYTAEQLQVGKKYAVNYLVDWELGPKNEQGKQYRNILAVRPNGA